MLRAKLSFLTLFLVVGCSSERNPLGADNYEMRAFGEDVYVLNTRTGAVFRIEDDVKVDIHADGRSIDDLMAEYDSRLVNFDTAIAEIVSVQGAVKLVGEVPKVRGSVGPYVPAVRKLTGVLFNLNFLDSDGFQLGTLSISASDLTRQVDGKGGYLGWSFQKDLFMDQSLVKLVQVVNATWYDPLNEAVDAWLKSEEGKAWQQARK